MSKVESSIDRNNKKCNASYVGAERLDAHYTQEPKLGMVVRGVYALAHALRDMREQLCPNAAFNLGAAAPPPFCPAMLPFNVSLYKVHDGTKPVYFIYYLIVFELLTNFSCLRIGIPIAGEIPRTRRRTGGIRQKR